MKHVIVLVLCFISGLGTGYIIKGKNSVPKQAKTESSLVRRAPSWIRHDSENGAALGASLLSSYPLRPLIGRILQKDSSLKMEEALEQILKSKETPQKTLNALVLLFSRWADIDVEEALGKAESLDPSMYLHYIKREIFSKMIARDPKEAAAYYEQNREALYAHSSYFLSELARQWAGQTPEEAWSWLAMAPGDELRKDVLEAFFSGLEPTPGVAAKYMDRVMADDGLRGEAPVLKIVQEWGVKNFRDTVNWIESQDKKYGRELWKAAIAGGAEADLDLATSYLSRLPASSLPGVIASVAGVVQRQEGSEAALDWMRENLPKGAEISDFSILSDWSGVDPEGAKKWLLSYASESQYARDRALEAYVSSSRDRNHEETLKMAQGIKNPESRKLAMKYALVIWKTEDPEAAHKWVEHFEGEKAIKEEFKKIID